MRYSRRTSNYLERITLFDLTHMLSMPDLFDINVETPRIDIGCSLEKESLATRSLKYHRLDAT